jgi:hypothetical protein
MILAAESAIGGRFRRRTSANGFERFSPDYRQKAHLTRVYEAAANRHRRIVSLLPALAPAERIGTYEDVCSRRAPKV